jgi:hypothetical protein
MQYAHNEISAILLENNEETNGWRTSSNMCRNWGYVGSTREIEETIGLNQSLYNKWTISDSLNLVNLEEEVRVFIFLVGFKEIDTLLNNYKIEQGSAFQSVMILTKLVAARMYQYGTLINVVKGCSQVSTTNQGRLKYQKNSITEFFSKVFDPTWQKASILLMSGEMFTKTYASNEWCSDWIKNRRWFRKSRQPWPKTNEDIR